MATVAIINHVFKKHLPDTLDNAPLDLPLNKDGLEKTPAIVYGCVGNYFCGFDSVWRRPQASRELGMPPAPSSPGPT